MNINDYINKYAVSAKWALTRMENGLVSRLAKVKSPSTTAKEAKAIIERTNLHLTGGVKHKKRLPYQAALTKPLEARVLAHSVQNPPYGPSLTSLQIPDRINRGGWGKSSTQATELREAVRVFKPPIIDGRMVGKARVERTRIGKGIRNHYPNGISK